MIYLGSLNNFDLVYAWAQDKCVPLVREITFENGEVRLLKACRCDRLIKFISSMISRSFFFFLVKHHTHRSGYEDAHTDIYTQNSLQDTH